MCIRDSAYGADAVYAGQPRYSLRVRNNEFNHANLKIGIDEAHALGKKFYVVVNIAPHNSKLKTFIKDLQPVIDMGPDALIMSDPGLIMLVRENFPDIDIHLSVPVSYTHLDVYKRQVICWHTNDFIVHFAIINEFHYTDNFCFKEYTRCKWLTS